MTATPGHSPSPSSRQSCRLSPARFGASTATATPVCDTLDQSCESEEARAYLHLRRYNDDDQATYVTTYVERHDPQATRAVQIGVDIDTGVKLTPAEARRLGRSLVRLARLARVPNLQIAATL